MEAAFPQFPRLPRELQIEVWGAALDQELEEAAVCIFGAYEEREPAMVDVDLYALMHACQTSRGLGRRHLGFRYQPEGPAGVCFGPCRPFWPDQDTLYLPSRAWLAFFNDAFLNGWSGRAELRHLALDQQRALDQEDVADYASYQGGFPSLRTVVIVAFSHSEAQLLARDRRVHPEPRAWPQYQLVEFSRGETIWDSPPGKVRREEIDPSDVATWFQEMCSTRHRHDNTQEAARSDGGSPGLPRFNTVTRRMIRKCKVSAGDADGWVSFILAGLRRFWQY